MARTERSQNGRSTVRVLRFPVPSPAPPADVDTDALADSIRKAWTQKSSPIKNQSGSRPGLPNLAEGKI
jgi:hypothetical protein